MVRRSRAISPLIHLHSLNHRFPPTKPVRNCIITVGNAYSAAGQVAACLHTMSLLQAYQAELLIDFDEGEGISPNTVCELRRGPLIVTFWVTLTLRKNYKNVLMDAPISPSGLYLIKEGIWLSRDFRKQPSSSPPCSYLRGCWAGAAPNIQSSSSHRATQTQSVAYRAPPHKDWGHGKRTQPQPSKSKTDLRTGINSKKAEVKWSWCPRVSGWHLNFTVPVSLRCPQGTGLPTLPPRVPQGAAVSGERISQGPPGNVVAFGMPAPSEGVSERSVQTLPASLPFQDFVLTAQLDRAWLIVLPHQRMGTREVCSTAAVKV